MAEIEATLTYLENCDYYSSLISDNINIDRRDVTIETTITICNWDKRKIEDKGQKTQTCIDGVFQSTRVFQPYHNDILQLEIHITVDDFDVKNKDVNVYYFNTYEDRTKLDTEHLLTPTPLLLDKEGKVGLRYLPHYDGYFVIEYNESTYFNRKVVEHPITLYKIPTEIKIEPKYRTELPTFVPLEHDIKFHAEVVDTYGNPPKDGAITFLTYRIHDINRPDDGWERVIGNPVIIEHEKDNEGNIIKAYGNTSYSPIQMFNKDATFQYNNQNGEITYTKDISSDFEVLFVTQMNYNDLNEEYHLSNIGITTEQLPCFIQINGNDEHKLRLKTNIENFNCGLGTQAQQTACFITHNHEAFSELYYDYNTEYGKLINNIEIIKAVYNYDNEVYGASRKYYQQHSGYTSLSLKIPGTIQGGPNLNLNMDIESGTNYAWQINEDGMYHYTNGDKIIIKSQLVDVDGNVVDLSRKHFAYNLNTHEYEEVQIDNNNRPINNPDNYDEVWDNVRVEGKLTLIFEGTKTIKIGDEYRYQEVEYRTEAVFDDESNMFIGTYDVDLMAQGVYTVYAELSVEGRSYPVQRANGYESVRIKDLENKREYVLFDEYYYEEAKSDKVYFDVTRVKPIDYIVNNIHKTTDDRYLGAYYNDNIDTYCDIEVIIRPIKNTNVDILNNKECYFYLTNEKQELMHATMHKINDNELSAIFNVNALKNLSVKNYNFQIKLKQNEIGNIIDTDDYSDTMSFIVSDRQIPVIGDIGYVQKMYLGNVNIPISVLHAPNPVQLQIEFTGENIPEIINRPNGDEFILPKKELQAGTYTIKVTCLQSEQYVEKSFTINKADLQARTAEIETLVGNQDISIDITCNGQIKDTQKELFKIVREKTYSPPLINNDELIAVRNPLTASNGEMISGQYGKGYIKHGWKNEDMWEVTFDVNTGNHAQLTGYILIKNADELTESNIYNGNIIGFDSASGGVITWDSTGQHTLLTTGDATKWRYNWVRITLQKIGHHYTAVLQQIGGTYVHTKEFDWDGFDNIDTLHLVVSRGNFYGGDIVVKNVQYKYMENYPIENKFIKSIPNNMVTIGTTVPILTEGEHEFKAIYLGDNNYNTLNPSTYSIKIMGNGVTATFKKIDTNTFNVNYQGHNSQFVLGIIKAISDNNEIRIPVISDIDGNFVIDEIDNWNSYLMFELTLNPKDDAIIELIKNSDEDDIFENLQEYYNNLTFKRNYYADDEHYQPLQCTLINARALLNQTIENEYEVLFTTYKAQTVW